MYLQGVESVYDIVWSISSFDGKVITYGDVHREGEYEFSRYNFEIATVDMLFRYFEDATRECKKCIENGLPLPAYDQCIVASHTFNLLDARKAISQTQRQNYILKIRELSKGCAQLYKYQEQEREERLERMKRLDFS
jgi:glycyl-tRNA synthetase alpha chain